MNRLRTLMLLLFTSVVSIVLAQVSVRVEQKRINAHEIDLLFHATIEQGWHVYSATMPAGGPTVAAFHVDKATGAEAIGQLQQKGKAIEHYDNMFEMNVSYFEQQATFVQRIRITQKDYSLKGYLEYGACNDQNCLPPSTVDVEVKGSNGPAAAQTQAPTTAATSETTNTAVDHSKTQTTTENTATRVVADRTEESAASSLDHTADELYTPVIDQLKALGENDAPADKALAYVFFLGFLGGLIALLTPCVWPIIPMTVSFFLHRNDNKRRATRDALIYGISIVVIYVSLGLTITALFGANALNDLSTNATFNILFFLMLVLFAASFLGGFEITLPSKWTNSVDERANNATGLLSIFLMAFTLTLVSFSCTGPIIGFLLVEVSTSGGSTLAPAIGMAGFALALALPFTLFALFPSWLKKAPRSGGWMNSVKVVLGFIELAFALKFLSVADLAYGWHILDREVFLALWIGIFFMLAAYLFGWIKFPHDDGEERNIGVTSFFVGLASLAFSIYMLPGLWGAPVKAVSAFAPPLSTQDFNLDPVKIEPAFTSYEEGMAYARKVGKPVLLDFTGHGCVNCRKMELAVWHDPKVRQLLTRDYVLISLYVDDKQRLAEPITVEENGQTRTLRTIGDKWSHLQRHRFGINSQPFYIPLNTKGQPLNHSYAFNPDVKAYTQFLKEGLEKFKAER